MRSRSFSNDSSLWLALLALGALGGCRGGEPGALPVGYGSGGGGGGGLVEASALACPKPAGLPFAVEATGFASVEAEEVAADNPRNKDEASDLLGNPGGVFGYTNMPLTDSPAGGDLVFTGKRARSPEGSGLTSIPIKGEAVSLWRYDPSDETWSSLARGTTSTSGEYRFELAGPIDEPTRPVYSVLEADETCAPHYPFLLDAGTKIVVTDIDGTLTLSDEELSKQFSDSSYVPLENKSAALMMNTWAEKGYQVVYLTARPHVFRAETRKWLDDLGYPVGPVITANQLVFGDSARQYKRTWVNRVVTDFGWVVTAAYGNATSDIDAYEDAGIPKDITFIIGESAGVAGTTAIDANDFSSHITDFVEQQPDA
ncbi:MAG: hypothetical protein KC731_00460 [Myxococcales bacterium]|nr:hypothetical protein [Myxococcales bacterium]